MNGEPDFELLLNRYLDGSATREEVARIDERLRFDAAARRQYAEFMNLDSALASLAADDLGATDGEPVLVERRIVAFPRVLRWVAVAAGIALLAGGGWWWQETQTVFAIVANGVGVEGLSAGMALRGEAQEIVAGTVEFVTARGARVVVEAPAAFRFESAQRLWLIHGRVAADVPPAAKGFTVVTPTGDAVDLGTKFGVDVPRDGLAEIHVFQGEVIAEPKGIKTRRSLRDGEALALQVGPDAARQMRSAAFIRPEEMAALSAGHADGGRARSEAAAAALRSDPALIAFLDFESAERGDGIFRSVQGRWPGSHAAEFVRVGDHLKIDVGGERAWPQLTLAAWVRIDRLGAPYQSLYHTDGWMEDKPGQVHWMINRDTTMRLALKQNTLAPDSLEKYGFPDSRTPVLPEQGRWVHLAVVYDSGARTVRFFLNGAFDHETRQEIAHPARLGPAQIGNWDAKDRKLSGRVDELLILGRAATDEEVRALFAAGNPYL